MTVTIADPSLSADDIALDADDERGGRARRRWLGATIGIIAVLALWELLAYTVFQHDHVLPPPQAVVHQIFVDGFYWQSLRQTGWEAIRGYLWGNLLAIGLALVFVLVPFVEQPLLRLSIASYCMPIIAIGPILQIVFSGDTPKVAMAALSVFFTTLIAMLLGLRSADPVSLDYVRARGGGRLLALWKVRLRAALSDLCAGLKIAAPAAMLGAIIGEYLGGDSGIGVAMINAQQALATERVWGLAVVASVVAGLASALTGVVAKVLTPWATRGPAT